MTLPERMTVMLVVALGGTGVVAIVSEAPVWAWALTAYALVVVSGRWVRTR